MRSVLDNLRAHATCAAIARVEVQIVHPAGSGAIHRRYRRMPAAIDRRRDDRIGLIGIEARRGIVDEVLHICLEGSLLGIVPICRLGQHTLQCALKSERRRACRRDAGLRIGNIHRTNADIGGQHLWRQAAHQRFEVAFVAGGNSNE